MTEPAAAAGTPPARRWWTARQPRQVWLRRAAIFVGVVLVVWVLAWLAVPPLLKAQAQTRLTALLGRPVTLGEVDFRPWSLELTLRDLVVGPPPGGTQPLLRVARVYADADAASLWRRAPVIAALELNGLQLQVARTASGHYDIDDLIARLAPAPDAPPSEPARFALYNLKLSDASLSFDDRPAQRVHRVDQLQLTLPFLSNLPSQVDIKVEPRLAFRLNGTPFDTGAQATPFASERRGELKLQFADLDLAPYLGYLPDALPVRLQRGAVSADLAVRFDVPPGGKPSVVIAGSAGLRGLALADASGAPLLAWRQLQLGLRDVQPLAQRLGFGSLRVEGAALHVARAADGRLNLQTLAGPPGAAASAAASPAAAAAPPWQVSLDQLEFDDARVLWNDAATRPAAALQLDGIRLQAKQLQWPAPPAVPLTLQATLRTQGDGAPAAGQIAIDARASDKEASGSLQLSALDLAAFAPYAAQALAPRLLGVLALQGRFDWSADAQAPRLAATLEGATLDGLKLVGGDGRGAQELAALKQLAIADAQIDLIGRQLTLGKLTLTQPALALGRDREGRWNATRWAVVPAAGAASAPPPAAAASTPVWRVQVKDAQLDAGRLQFADAFAAGRAADEPLRIEASALRLRVQEFAWPGGRGVAPAKVQFGARIGPPAAAHEAAAPAGSIDWNGRFAAEPMLAAGTLRIERFPVHLFEPYFGEQIRLSLLRAEANLKGEFSAQAAPNGWRVTAGGDARLADVRVHTRPEAGVAATDELLSWQSFNLDGIKFAMQPASVPQLEIREAALNDFFARLVITEQGRFNLSGVTSAPAAAASAPAAPASAPAPATAASSAEPPIAFSIGGVKLSNGRIDFSDHFVRPNYSANLSELNGQLGAFRTGTRDMATLELHGRAAGTAILDIRGALNPTANPLALDIQAKATDLELAPFSPYAGKYAGYAIERGKLSMEVAYKITPDGKLDAKNQVILNQLTFGEKVDSPDATKLPVLLALALLKDRNGVIDINLPVSGSINDPQFSVFGIVLKIIGNLLVKALTAPFALFSGGDSQDLSLVEFKPGTALFAPAGQGALDKVAKALADRPALRMTVTGAADPVSEREDFQRAALDARLLAERRRELLRSGASQADADAVATLEPETRARLLKEVYKQTDLKTKPRNALGFARDIPGPEMEALLTANSVVTAEAMRELALQRGLAVRDALIAKGLPSERLFLAAPKLRASGEEDAAWTPRVQLTLATN